MGAVARTRTVAEQRAHLAREAVEVLLFVALIFGIVHFTIQTFRLQDTAMSPQFKPEQLVLVNKAAYLLGGPQRGEVVLFNDPSNPRELRLRRVIAVPGDTIALTASNVIVNGVVLNEPYTTVPFGTPQNNVVSAGIRLKQDEYYTMCDSRLASTCSDSRAFGVVPRRNLVGKAVVVFWPLSAFHWVSTYSDTYSRLPSR